MSIEYRGETFEGYNKPKRTPNHPTKSHAVRAAGGKRQPTTARREQGRQGAAGELQGQACQEHREGQAERGVLGKCGKMELT